jgi:hypothetical protein
MLRLDGVSVHDRVSVDRLESRPPGVDTAFSHLAGCGA